MILKRSLLILPILLISSQASAFEVPYLKDVIDFFTPNQVSEKQIKECGNKIKDFKRFLRDIRQCNTTADCAHVKAKCPLSCHFFVNKMFAPIVEKEIGIVLETCDGAITNCNKCLPYDAKAICKNRVCRGG